MENKRRFDPVAVGIIVCSIIILAGISVAFYSTSISKPASYNITDQERPKIEISEKEFDLGKMKLSETKTKEVTLKNVGNKPLSISNFSTSCDCTFVQVVVGEKTSPKFSMHSMLSWQKELLPNETATLKIIYQPSVMPVEGEVSRVVYFKTNDPAYLDVKIGFKAFVEK
jgi:hypothetical protein